MNTFMETLNNANNYSYTENGALTHRSTMSKVYDMFALGAAYRSRSDDDCIFLFKKAFEENRDLALKCLFYIRDCRGGQGERRFFRVCIKWLAKEYPSIMDKLIKHVPEFGRWDDLFELLDTPCQDHVIELVVEQLTCDMACEKNGVSLCAKWCPSENTSSAITRTKATKIRTAMKLSSRQYRKMLSKLREKINVLERLMSANKWDKIEFDKIPSKAGLIYKNAFARRDIIAKKYEAFAKDKSTRVNATTLYPYEVVHKAVGGAGWGCYFKDLNETDRAMINKYWENLPDYVNGSDFSMMCVVDTSGSMTGNTANAPINIAIGLGMYCAERAGGPFKNRYISFSSRPQLIEVEGVDFVDKARRIYATNLCENTNIEAVFDLLLKVAQQPGVKREDIPKTLIILSDMEIDSGTGGWRNNGKRWTSKTAGTEMEKIRSRWAAAGYEIPHLVYWNLSARHDNILDSGPNVTFVSGASPTIFKQVVTGKTGIDLMLETLLAKRYNEIIA